MTEGNQNIWVKYSQTQLV